MSRAWVAFLGAVFRGISIGRGEGNGDRDFPRGGNGGGVKYIMAALLTIRTMLIMGVGASPRGPGLIGASLGFSGLG